jgi:hypothetical protein
VSHGLPNPPSEPPVIQSLDCLATGFHTRVSVMLAQFAAQGFDPVVAESCRTPERQAWLFGFGREWDDGRGVVTQAATGEHSWHTYGLAVDITSQRNGWDAPAAFWRALGECAKAQGLTWGGSWPRFQDRPHVQAGPPMAQAPSSRATQLFSDGGFEAVWSAVGWA